MEMKGPGQSIPEIITNTKPQCHYFLFGGENFMTVDPSGHVSVLTLPSFPFNICSFLNNQTTLPKDVPMTETADLDSPSGKLGDNEGEMHLSPRLTHYMEEGIVPESPMVKSTPFPLNTDSPRVMASQLKDIEVEMNGKLYTPLVKHTRESSSEDWRVMSGSGASSSVKRPPKYRRLRKAGGVVKRRVCADLEESCEGTLRKENRLADGAILNKKQADKGSKSFNSTAFFWYLHELIWYCFILNSLFIASLDACTSEICMRTCILLEKSL